MAAHAVNQGCSTYTCRHQTRFHAAGLIRRPCSTARHDLLVCASKRGRGPEPQQVAVAETTCLSATEKLISLAQRPNVPVGSAAAVEALGVLEAHLPSHLSHLPLPRLCSSLWALARLQLTPSQALQDCIADHLLTVPPPEAVQQAAQAAAAATPEQRRRGGSDSATGVVQKSWQQQQDQQAPQWEQQQQQQAMQWEQQQQQQHQQQQQPPGPGSSGEEEEEQRLLEERRSSNAAASSSSPGGQQLGLPNSSSSSSSPSISTPLTTSSSSSKPVTTQPMCWLHLADRYSLGAVVYGFNAFGYNRLVFWGALAAVLTSQLELTKSNILGNMLKSVAEVYYSSRAPPAESASDSDSPATQGGSRGGLSLSQQVGAGAAAKEAAVAASKAAAAAAREAAAAAAALDGFSLALTQLLLRRPELLVRWRLRDVAALVGCLAVSAAGRVETQQLLRVLAEQLLLDPTGRRLAACRPGDAATIAWGYVHCGVPHAQLLAALARQIAATAPDLRAPDLGKLLWAYATVNVVDRSMLTELGVWVSEAVHEVHPRVAAAVVWSCGKLRQPVPALMEAALDRLASCLEAGLPPGRVDTLGFEPNQPPTATAAAVLPVPPPQPPAAAATTTAAAVAPGPPQPPAATAAAAAGAPRRPGPSLLQQLLADARDTEASEGPAGAAGGSSGSSSSGGGGTGGQRLTICPPVAPVEPVVNPVGLTSVNEVSPASESGSSSSSSHLSSTGALCAVAGTAQHDISIGSQSQRPRLTWGGQPGDVAHALWGAGRLGHDNKAFLVAATAAVPLLVFDWSNAQLVGALWGYARLGWYPGQPAMEAFEQQLLARAGQLTARQVVMVNWSCAVLRHRSTPMLTVLTARILDLIKQQQVAAAAAGPGGSLMHSWQQQPFDYAVDPAVDFDWSVPEDEAVMGVQGWGPVPHVDAASAMMTGETKDDSSSSSSSGGAASSQQRVNIAVRREAMAPVSAVLLAWSCAHLHHRDPQLYQALASILLPAVPRMGVPAVCQLLWAYATAGQLNERLWTAAYQRLTRLTATRAVQLNPSCLMQLFQADRFLQDCFQGSGRPPARLPRPLATAAEQRWLAAARRGVPRGASLYEDTRHLPAAATTSSSSGSGSSGSGWTAGVATSTSSSRREVVTFMTTTTSSSSSKGGGRTVVNDADADADGMGVPAVAGRTFPAAPGVTQADSAPVSSSSGSGSLLSQEVLTVLRLLGLTPQVEALTRDGLYSLDMVVTWRDKRVAVEVDGPLHFSANRPYTPLGPTLSRRRSLAARGYYVCSVPFYEWRQLGRLVPLDVRVARHGQQRAVRQRQQQQKALMRRTGLGQHRRVAGRSPNPNSADPEDSSSSEEGGAGLVAAAAAGLGGGVLKGVTPDQAAQHMEYLRAVLDEAVRTPITAWLD